MKHYHLHIIEGTSFKKHIENNQYVEDFVADKCNTWTWITPQTLHGALVKRNFSMSIEWLTEALEAGSNCLVIDHSDAGKGKINIHLMPDPEATGVLPDPATMMQ